MSRYDGLDILYDGKMYTVLIGSQRMTYGVGELLLKADWLPREEVINWVRSDPCSNEPVDPGQWENIIGFVCMYAAEQITSHELLTLFIAVVGGAAQKISGIMQKGADYTERYIRETNEVLYSDDIDHEARLRLIGRDIALDSAGDFLIACFNEYYLAYQDYRNFLSAIASDYSGIADSQDSYAIEVLKKLYKEYSPYQEIGCRIVYDAESGKFTTMYQIRSLYALLAFEYAHMQETGAAIKVCANCGRLFIPANRSDEIYCSNEAPDDKKHRTCREVGAWISHKNKIAKDETEAAFRRKYQYFNVAYNRHKGTEEGKALSERRERFKREGREMRKKLKEGLMTSDQFLEWINSF